MPPRIKRPCRVKLCKQLTTSQHGYCEAHVSKVFESLRNSATAKDIAEKNSFYDSKEWRLFRREYILNNCDCVMCNGLATVADHIKPRRYYPELAFTPSNIQALCAKCHTAKTAREINARRYRKTEQDDY